MIGEWDPDNPDDKFKPPDTVRLPSISYQVTKPEDLLDGGSIIRTHPQPFEALHSEFRRHVLESILGSIERFAEEGMMIDLSLKETKEERRSREMREKYPVDTSEHISASEVNDWLRTL